jgi:hypothetical protein
MSDLVSILTEKLSAAETERESMRSRLAAAEALLVEACECLPVGRKLRERIDAHLAAAREGEAPPAYVEVGQLVDADGFGTIFAEWLPVRWTLPVGTKLYAASATAAREGEK